MAVEGASCMEASFSGYTSVHMSDSNKANLVYLDHAKGRGICGLRHGLANVHVLCQYILDFRLY